MAVQDRIRLTGSLRKGPRKGALLLSGFQLGGGIWPDATRFAKRACLRAASRSRSGINLNERRGKAATRRSWAPR